MAATKTTIEYEYEPSDLFEQSLEIAAKHGALTFDSGKAAYVLAAPVEPVPEKMMEEVREEVTALLDSREMVAHRASKIISGPATKFDQASGGQNVDVALTGQSMTIMAGNLDTVATHSTGKVFHDSKSERIRADTDFLLAVAPNMGNPTLRKMVKSYDAAVRDKAKELSHLYEIVEAAEKLYGNRSATCKTLGFTKGEWDAITEPANNPEIKQGRHTGKAIKTRDATNEELDNARHLAREIVRRHAATVQ
jgi:hypothetical protein